MLKRTENLWRLRLGAVKRRARSAIGHALRGGRSQRSPDETNASDDALADAIRQIYRAVLYRTPTEQEVRSWLVSIRSGRSFFQFWNDMSCSPEARGEMAGEGGWPHETRASDDALSDAIRRIYQAVLYRSAADHEVSSWLTAIRSGLSFFKFWNDISNSPEARGWTVAAGGLPDWKFVMHAYEALLLRGATPSDVAMWRDQLGSGALTRGQLLTTLFANYVHVQDEARRPAPWSGSARIAGTDQTLTRELWADLVACKDKPDRSRPLPSPPNSQARFPMRTSGRGILVSIITSVYRGRKYIARFLDNITSQTIFSECCELIIIDANSPEGEAEAIEDYRARFPQIVYNRLPHRIGLYAAWNLGVSLARGHYLTNANLDDLRRNDSLELQAATLDGLPFVDVVYQDFFYSLDDALSFDEVADVGVRSRLSVVTAHNLVRFNAPHNAPMWRKRLHSDVGMFDERLWSAGDYEFWVRCLMAGKTFFKLNHPHVAYYVNPDGISTRPDGRGLEEGNWISRRYWRHLLPRASVEDMPGFLQRCGAPHGLPAESSRYDIVQSLLRAAAGQHERGRLVDELRGGKRASVG